MSIKQILLLVSTASLLFSSGVFAQQNSWANRYFGVDGTVREIATDSRGAEMKFNVEIKPNNIGGNPGGCKQGDGDINFSITNSGYSTLGTYQQQKQDMWKNMILLAKSTGAVLIADVGNDCELWDLRML